MHEDDLELFKGSLPDRQLRKMTKSCHKGRLSSLPDRQLRKCCIGFYLYRFSSLPDRQLRKI